jgi:hypothetical protein
MAMISRNFEIYNSRRTNYKTVDPDSFIERLKKIRAVDPNSSHFDKDGRELKDVAFTFLLRKR